MAENGLVPSRNQAAAVRGPIQDFLRRVLNVTVDLRKGGRLPEDTPAEEARALLEALDRRFVKQVDEKTGRVTFVPAAPGISAEITPEEVCLARLGHKVQSLQVDVRLVESIEMIGGCFSEGCVAAQRCIVAGHLRALQNEVQQSQPRLGYIDKLLDTLLGERGHEGDLEQLAERAGLIELIRDDKEQVTAVRTSKFVCTPAQETMLVSYQQVRDDLICLREAFQDFTDQVTLGCNLAQIRTALAVIPEQVQELREQLAGDGISEGILRGRILRFAPRTAKVPLQMTLYAFVKLNQTEAERFAYELSCGGRPALTAIEDLVDYLAELNNLALGSRRSYQLVGQSTQDELVELVRHSIVLARVSAAKSKEAEAEKQKDELYGAVPEPGLIDIFKRSPASAFCFFTIQEQWNQIARMIHAVNAGESFLASAARAQ